MLDLKKFLLHRKLMNCTLLFTSCHFMDFLQFFESCFVKLQFNGKSYMQIKKIILLRETLVVVINKYS